MRARWAYVAPVTYIPDAADNSSTPLARGFLLPALVTNDDTLYGRWDYLTDAWEAGALPDAPIPPCRSYPPRTKPHGT